MYKVKPDGKGKFIVITEKGEVYKDPCTGKPARYSRSGTAQQAALVLNKRSGR